MSPKARGAAKPTMRFPQAQDKQLQDLTIAVRQDGSAEHNDVVDNGNNLPKPRENT